MVVVARADPAGRTFSSWWAYPLAVEKALMKLTLVPYGFKSTNENIAP